MITIQCPDSATARTIVEALGTSATREEPVLAILRDEARILLPYLHASSVECARNLVALLMRLLPESIDCNDIEFCAYPVLTGCDR